MRKVLASRCWHLLQLRSLGHEVDARELDVETILARCKSPDFSFFSNGGGKAASLPPTLVFAWRDVSQRLQRVREQLKRLPAQVARAQDYWRGLEELTTEVLRLKQTRITELRGQLQAPAGAVAPQANTVLEELEALEGERYVLRSSLRSAEAMVKRGKIAEDDFLSRGGSLPGGPGPLPAAGQAGGAAASAYGPSGGGVDPESMPAAAAKLMDLDSEPDSLCEAEEGGLSDMEVPMVEGDIEEGEGELEEDWQETLE